MSARARSTEAEVLHLDRQGGRLSAGTVLRIPTADVLRDVRRGRFGPADAVAGGEGDGTFGVEIQRIGRGDDE